MTADKTPVQILIRGLIRARYHWGDFPQILQTHLPAGTRLLTPEVAGNGERFQENTPFSVHGMMLDLREQVRKDGGLDNGPVVLIAISMGAMIASEWARCFPQEVKALRLINTSFSNLSLPWQRMRTPAFFSLLSRFIGPFSLEQGILHWSSNHERSALSKDWEAYAQRHPLSLRNALAQILAASRYKGPLTAPVDDVEFYVSERDRLVSSQCTRRIAHQWHKPLHVHVSAGHDLPLDDAPWLIRKLTAQQEPS